MKLKEYIEKHSKEELYIGTEAGGGWLYIGPAEDALEMLRECRYAWILKTAERVLNDLKEAENRAITRGSLNRPDDIIKAANAMIAARPRAAKKITNLGKFPEFEEREVVSAVLNELDADGKASGAATGIKIVVEGNEPCAFFHKKEFDECTAYGTRLYSFHTKRL